MNHRQQQLSGVTDFLTSQWTIISSYWMKTYERAKAKLMAFVGEFLQQRQVLLKMKKRVAFLLNRADKTNNSALRSTALDLQRQIDSTYDEQISLEDKVQTALSKMRMVDQAKQDPEGVGQDPIVTPTVILGIAGILSVTGILVYKHIAKVKFLNKLLRDVENKVLTPAEAATLAKQQDRGLIPDLLGDATPYLIGGAVIIAGLILFSRRR